MDSINVDNKIWIPGSIEEVFSNIDYSIMGHGIFMSILYTFTLPIYAFIPDYAKLITLIIFLAGISLNMVQFIVEMISNYRERNSGALYGQAIGAFMVFVGFFASLFVKNNIWQYVMYWIGMFLGIFTSMAITLGIPLLTNVLEISGFFLGFLSSVFAMGFVFNFLTEYAKSEETDVNFIRYIGVGYSIIFFIMCLICINLAGEINGFDDVI